MTRTNFVEVQETVLRRAGGDEMLSLFHTFQQTRDLALRDRLVCEHLYLVHSIVRRFSGLGESLDDLIQEGTIGLLNAVDMFDPDRGVKFSTYACHLIASQIQHYLRDRGRLIRQPAWVQELNAKVTRATEQLSQELGRDPSPIEVAERLQIAENSVKNVLAARELNHVVSLHVPTDGNGESEQSVLDQEKTSTDKQHNGPLPVEDRIVLEEAINSLKTLEQQVVRQYFFNDLNQTEIARKMGISVNYASYLLRRAINKIKAMLDEQRAQERAALIEAEALAAPPAPIAADLATHDAVTGIYSGGYLRLRVAEEIARSRRYPNNFALMMAQVRGMSADPRECQTVLTAISHLLRGSTRVVDLIGHQGDGVFVLLLPHTGREARVLGERLCRRIALQEGVPVFGNDSLTLNVGYAVFPMDGATVEMLFSRTEQALAAAVKSGPNTTLGVAAALGRK